MTQENKTKAAQDAQPTRKIVWTYLVLALMAALGLALALVTAWTDWKEPMLGFPVNFDIMLLSLFVALGSALAMTFNKFPPALFIALAIVFGLLMQLQVQGMTHAGHKMTAPAAVTAPAHTASPADNDRPPAAKK